MIDRAYFEKHLPAQSDEFGGPVRVEIHLHDGSQFFMQSLRQVADGYVVLCVFPPEGVNGESKAARRKRGGDDTVYWDQLTIPYGCIAYTVVSITREENSAVGFEAAIPRQLPKRT